MFRSAKNKNYNILLKFTTQWTHYLDLIVVVVGLVVVVVVVKRFYV